MGNETSTTESVNVFALVTKNFLKKKMSPNAIVGWGGGYLLVKKGHPFYGKSIEDCNTLLQVLRDRIKGFPLITIADHASKHANLIGAGKFLIGEKETALEEAKQLWLFGYAAHAHRMGCDELKSFTQAFGYKLQEMTK